MGIIWISYDGTGNRDPDPSVFFQCVNGQDPMANDFWSHGLDSLCSDAQPTAQVLIPPRTEGEFITDYLTTNRRRIRIFGQYVFMDL